MELELFINGEWERLDTDNETNTLTLSFTFDSVDNPSDYYSDFSYPFKVPRTSRNNILLKNICRLDSIKNYTPLKYNYRLYGEGNILLSEGQAVVESNNLKDYTLQLNGDMGINFNKLLKSGFSESDELNYYQLPDIINYGGEEYDLQVLFERNLVYTSFNIDSHDIPFSIDDLYDNYGDLFNTYYSGVDRTGLTEQMAWASSFVGFMPQMQGRYKNFDSTKWVDYSKILPLFTHLHPLYDEKEQDLGEGLTDFQMQQYRSYYQTPYVYVQKLWEIYKRWCHDITGYDLILDNRWYNENNMILKDLVYTLPNIGNSESLEPKPVGDAMIDPNPVRMRVPLPVNSQYHSRTHQLFGLSDVAWEVVPSDILHVDKYDELTFTTQFTLSISSQFTGGTGPMIPWDFYEVDGVRYEDLSIAYNNNNPIKVEWWVEDSMGNHVFDSPRGFYLYSIAKYQDFTEGVDSTSFLDYAVDNIGSYYEPDELKDVRDSYIDRAEFGTFQVKTTWLNDYASGDYRIRYRFSFANDLVPVYYFFPHKPEGDNIGYDDDIMHTYYCNPVDSSKFLDATIEYTKTTQVFEPVRSYRRITTADLFGDEKPFNILLKYSKMNNLVWLIDEVEKNITVKRRYDWVEENMGQGFYDITENVNVEEEFLVTQKSYDAGKILFSFQDSADTYSKDYTKKYGKPYGTLTLYTEDVDSSESIKAFDNDTSKFYPPIVATDILTPRSKYPLNQSFKVETPIALPSNKNDSGEYAGVSGVFYERGENWEVNENEFVYYRVPHIPSLLPIPAILITDDSIWEINNEVYCYHNDSVSYLPYKTTTSFPQFFEHTRDNLFTIWFGEPREFYYEIPDEVRNNSLSIYDNEWKNWVDELYNINNKRVSYYAVINDDIYRRLKKNPLVQMENVIFMNEKIEYNPSKKTAKITMRSMPEPSLYRSDWFYVENITSGIEGITISSTGTGAPNLTIEGSYDGMIWEELGSTGIAPITFQLNPGEKRYLRCYSTALSFNNSSYNHITGCSKVGGNILSMEYGANFNAFCTEPRSRASYAFSSFFRSNSNLIDASDLRLQCTTAYDYFYAYMFSDCIRLKYPPVLPATTLTTGAYQNMFSFCSAMETAPDLIFTGYLPSRCYQNMFRWCTNLVYIRCLAAGPLSGGSNQTSGWVYRTGARGTFVKSRGSSWSSGDDGIPAGWMIIEE